MRQYRIHAIDLIKNYEKTELTANKERVLAITLEWYNKYQELGLATGIIPIEEESKKRGALQGYSVYGTDEDGEQVDLVFVFIFDEGDNPNVLMAAA